MDLFLSSRIVLTAAHCGPAQYNLNNKITVGAWKRSNLNNSPAQNAEKIKVTKVSEHPDYNDDTVNNDYALLLLKTPYVIDSAIYLRLNNDAALPSAKMKLDVLGMGTTKEDGNVAEMLRDVQVPAMTNKECKKKISGGITNKMVCAAVLFLLLLCDKNNCVLAFTYLLLLLIIYLLCISHTKYTYIVSYVRVMRRE